MRLLFVINSRIAKWGSFEDFMIGMARLVRERGDRVGFVFPEAREEKVIVELKRWAEVFFVKGNWQDVSCVRQIADVVIEFKPSVVNTHFCDFMSFAHFYWFLRRRGIKGVYHYHGEISPIEEMAWWKRFVSSIRIFSWWADKIITVSKANRNFLEFLRVRPQIEVIYNGISVEKFLGREPDVSFLHQFGLRKGERFICYLGSLNERKRIWFLLDAFSRVAMRVENVRLVVMGKGNVEHWRSEADRLGIGDRVIFTGLVEEYPYGVIAAADVFVSASKQESFGLVFAEALLLGTPVVACRVGGIPEVVIDGKSGCLVERDDVEGFAEAVVELLNDDNLRRKMAEFGRKYVLENFAMDKIVPKVYEKLRN